jgi:NTP pyrophosphatase (non-canonical NTP hydrolase)
MPNEPHAPIGAEIAELRTLAFSELRIANVLRQAEWCPDPDQQPDLSFRGNELAGETGEACNVIKKLERARHGWRGSLASYEDLADELADVVICADLVAWQAGVDLGAAVVRKFNATSKKQGHSVTLAERGLAAGAGETDSLKTPIHMTRIPISTPFAHGMTAGRASTGKTNERHAHDAHTRGVAGAR